jgi:hypothetical protein
VDASPDAGPGTEPEAEPAQSSKSDQKARLRSITKLAVVDVGAPLAAYYLMRGAGLSTVTALVLSGIFPAAGVAAGIIGHRRLDLVGALVLAGIIVGTVLGLISGNARLVLLEGSVPTAIFGLGCLITLLTSRPMMFGFAVEFVGPDTAKGREMLGLWKYPGFRRIFWVITAVWGIGFVLEAALKVIIVYGTSAGTALALTNVTPYIWAGFLMAWTIAYGRYQGKKGRQIMEQMRAAAEGPDAPGPNPPLAGQQGQAPADRDADAVADLGGADPVLGRGAAVRGALAQRAAERADD